MSENPKRKTPEFFMADIRSRIVSDPSIVLDAPDVLMAVAAAAEGDFGEKVFDMREVALSVLKARLDGHRETHKKVIAATYDNHVGTQNMHRAVLALIEAGNVNSLLTTMREDIPKILNVDAVRLVVEAPQSATEYETLAGTSLGEFVMFCPQGSVQDYLDSSPDAAQGKAILRQVEFGADEIYGSVGSLIRSEALLCLQPSKRGLRSDAWLRRANAPSQGGVSGKTEIPWLLAMGSRSPEQFRPGMGTDLLSFFGEALVRVLKIWLKD